MSDKGSVYGEGISGRRGVGGTLYRSWARELFAHFFIIKRKQFTNLIWRGWEMGGGGGGQGDLGWRPLDFQAKEEGCFS